MLYASGYSGQHCHFKPRVPSKVEGLQINIATTEHHKLAQNEEQIKMLTSSDQNKSSEPTLPSSCTFFCATALVLLGGDLLLLLDLEVPKPYLRCLRDNLPSRKGNPHARISSTSSPESYCTSCLTSWANRDLLGGGNMGTALPHERTSESLRWLFYIGKVELRQPSTK